jgi:hypothetical protein
MTGGQAASVGVISRDGVERHGVAPWRRWPLRKFAGAGLLPHAPDTSMIEKLIANRFLALPNFDSTPPAIDADGLPARFMRIPDRLYSIQESTSSGPFYNRTKTSQVSAGAHANQAKQHRTFRWLPWVPGQITCVTLAGADILTGPMSGCWLTIFSIDGIRYVGHIGTEDSSTSDNTIAVKAAWRAAVNNGAIVPVAAFNPVGPALNIAQLGLNGEAPGFFGGVTTSGTMSTVVITRPAGRVVIVQRQRTTPDVTAF